MKQTGLKCVHLSRNQHIKGLFVSRITGMPYWHVDSEVLDKEGTHHFVQSVKEEKPSTERNIINMKNIIVLMYIMRLPKYRG